MASVILFFIFLAFYVLYNTSKKVLLNNYFGVEKWIAQKNKTGKIIGSGMLLISCILSCMAFGIAVGTCFFFIALMTLGSLTIILTPLKLLKPIPLIILFTISLGLELLISY